MAILRRLKVWVSLLFSIFLITLALIFADVQLKKITRIYQSPHETPSAPIAIILGAGITNDGRPSDALRDRLLVGKELYEQNKVESLLLSGDGGKFRRDEIRAMRNFLLEQGLPAHVLQEDPEGYRTYETCKRAASVFGIKKAILVTQRFHLGRALYLCDSFGMDVAGTSADLQTYRRIVYFVLRDVGASIKAWIDINLYPPKPPVS